MNRSEVAQSVQTVGIDLGTTFSTVAIVDQNGKAKAIPNAEGLLTTPSVAIWYENTFIVGKPALDLVARAGSTEREQMTKALIRGVKRMIGQPLNGELISGGRNTTPVEVSAAILAKLARDASAHLGFLVSDAVITVPAHFDDAERSATKLAAEMAGLNVLQIMNEPSAAALTYSYGKKIEPGIALVFDLGGGTFDVTVLRCDDTGARVLATQGIEELGGINFTNKLASDLQRRYGTVMHQPYPDDSVSSTALLSEAERAKCLLSEEREVVVHLTPNGGAPADIQVARKQFERLIGLYIIHLQTAVEIALERAKITPADVQRVLLCGGSSRIPAVQAMLEELFGKPPECILDLDLSVALGAAYQALNCERAQRPQSPTSPLQLLPGGLIVDCVSYPVGIAIMNARGDQLVKLVMLHPGDPLDVWSPPFAVRIASIAGSFPPIDVYKGEDQQLESSDYLGNIAISLPPGTAAGARATIRMLQDQSGIVQIQIAVNEQAIPGNLQRAQR